VTPESVSYPRIPAYSERLDKLLALEFFGMKLGLDNIRALLERIGNPQDSYPSIHIAGTNGKGSVASTLAAIYQSDGRRVGLYLSPHLIDFRERIRVSGAMIDEENVVGFLDDVWPFVEEHNMTFFEVTTALAFKYFADQKVDIAIIETGLGGRLDATNVLKQPQATIVTSIAMDHMAQLGNTLESIAEEKSGIFKPGSPAVVHCQRELRSVFAKRARQCNVPLTFVDDFIQDDDYGRVQPSLAGKHQADNLKTVLTTLSVLGHPVSRSAVVDGVANTASLVNLHGRLESFRDAVFSARGVDLLLDVAHNPAAFERIADYFEQKDVRPIVVVGLMKDKDIAAIVEQIARFAASVITVSIPTERALGAGDLAKYFSDAGLKVQSTDSPASGVSFAVSISKQGDTVLLTGSHYIIGDFLKNFRKSSRVRD
jgi:dihydrofolate synthase/folylpolyglutamate synthase